MSGPWNAVGRVRISGPALATAAATALFLAFSAWWLTIDQRLPGGGDPARHLSVAGAASSSLREGDLLSILDFGPIGDEFFYPPAVHLVGAVPAALDLDLAIEDWGTFAVNLVFVPLLAAGCYLVGRRVYGPTAGLLAAIFALGTPMVLSLFHVFLLDAPLAGSVAIALAALLASERFERRRESIVAGALVGLALLVKTNSPLFLAGPVAVMLIGGGWRRWQNVGLAAVAMLVVAAPYYLGHLDETLSVSEASTVGGDIGASGVAFSEDPRFSFDNLTYYGWAAVNIQYYLPLLGFFAAGLVVAARHVRRLPHMPELLAGLAVGYLASTLALSFRDPRYTLPLLVYIAVIATGWITTIRVRRVGIAATAALALVVAVNVWSAARLGEPRLKVNLYGDQSPNPLDPGAVTVAGDRGYTVGPPLRDDLWHRLFAAAEAEGLTSAQITLREVPLWGTDRLGFTLVASRYGIAETTFADPALRRSSDLRINTWHTRDSYWTGEEGLPQPCGTVAEGARAGPIWSPEEGWGPEEVSVAVERRIDGSYERWCEF